MEVYERTKTPVNLWISDIAWDDAMIDWRKWRKIHAELAYTSSQVCEMFWCTKQAFQYRIKRYSIKRFKLMWFKEDLFTWEELLRLMVANQK